jgi:signal transduction histidine kinase
MLKINSFQTNGKWWFELVAGRFARRIVPVIYVICALAFLSDMDRDDTLAYGIIYTPLVATAVFHKRRFGVWVLTMLACVLVVLGALFPVVNTNLPDMIANRLLSIMAIVSTAAFVHHARDIQERLADQTRRAEAAERIKTDVLTDLSEEIRTPLHALLAVLTLTMASSRPDQREALQRVRSDGKQLLATIDNLIDLSQIDDHALERKSVDVATIAQAAVETAGTTARDRQVTVALDVRGAAGATTAIGDSWAIRRILDNFLANAVRLTPPGSTVLVAVDRSGDTVTAAVNDTGRGLPLEVTREFDANASPGDSSTLPVNGGAGLALSSRLARTMNGRVIARNQPGSGATVSLTLPAA